MWRNIKIWTAMIFACAVWALGISPGVTTALGVVPTSAVSVIIGFAVGLIGYKIKSWLDAEDLRFKRYERKLINKIHEIMEEDKIGY